VSNLFGKWSLNPKSKNKILQNAPNDYYQKMAINLMRVIVSFGNWDNLSYSIVRGYHTGHVK
jgi:hypothetical protein